MLTEVGTMSEASVFCANPFAKARVVPDWTRDNPDQVKLESLTREIKELITLYNVGAAVGSSLNLKEVLWTLYQESGRLVDTSNFALAIYDDRTDTLAFPLAFDRGERVKPFSVKRSNDQGLTSHVLTTQAPLLIRDLLETEGGG